MCWTIEMWAVQGEPPSVGASPTNAMEGEMGLVIIIVLLACILFCVAGGRAAVHRGMTHLGRLIWIIAGVLTLWAIFSPAAHAQLPENVMMCGRLGVAYQTAAQMRDYGTKTPQETYDYLASLNLAEPRLIKIAVNLVYFDDRFANAGGYSLQQQIMHICLEGEPNYKPVE